MTSAAGERDLAMAREMLDIVNRRGWETLFEEPDRFAHPEIEWRGVATGRDAPGGNVVYRGVEGLAAEVSAGA